MKKNSHAADPVWWVRMIVLAAFVASAPCGALGAAPPLVVEVWPDKAPEESGSIGPERTRLSPKLDRKQVEVTDQTRLITDVTKPTLTIYRPDKDKDTGTAMLICPGGGYWDLYWQLEGEEVADWLNSNGVTGIILKYRVPRRPDEPKGEPARRPLQDAQRAVSLVRSKAKEWGIDPDRIGIVGFSAGGHLAIATATSFEQRTYASIDDIDKVSCRPDFAILAYPGYLKAKDKDELAPGFRIPPGTPPVFLAHGGADIISPPDQSVLMYLALKRAGIPAELHIYATAAHDFGVRPSEHPCSNWTQSCVNWLRYHGFLNQVHHSVRAPNAVATLAGAPAQVPISSEASPPPTPSLQDLTLKESVSQYGVTWTFQKPARVGQFINGDWYVVGPTTIATIDPVPRYGREVVDEELDSREKVSFDQRCRNGSMLNVPARQEVAWDSGILNYYHPEHRARLPISMNPGDSLASSVSLRKGEKVTYPYHPGTVRGEGDNSPVKIVAVLTCVDGPMPADAFRPSYAGHDAKIHLARDIKRELLPHFERPSDTPDPGKFAENFQRPWCDMGFFSFDVPQESMPNYAQWYAQGPANAVLLACCEGTKPEDKERLLVNVIQIGIDHYGLLQRGHPGWPAHGGHGSGRKFPIVFAGAMLGDDAMANINKTFPKAAFGEDEQTAYGDCWTGAKVVFTGHSGIDAVTGIGRDFVRAGNPWGPYEHLAPDKWVPEEFRSEAYRRANTSVCFVAQALVLRAMKLEKAWGHDAFFDYVDRWMFEDDKPSRIEIAKYCRPPYNKDDYLDESKDWFHQGYADRGWVKQLWTKYRPRCPAQTDGWKLQHDDSYYLNAVAKQRKK